MCKSRNANGSNELSDTQIDPEIRVRVGGGGMNLQVEDVC